MKAIEQGRSIYANIKKAVLFLLSSNFGEIITMLATTLLYGVLIATISMSAFLQLPLRLLMNNDLPLTLSNLCMILNVPEVLTHSQTYAFTALGISQLFHAIGMRDVECSVFLSAMPLLAHEILLLPRYFKSRSTSA